MSSPPTTPDHTQYVLDRDAFYRQIESYPFLNNDNLSEQITIIITTSAVKSNPSTYLVDTVIQSFAFAANLTKCKKIVICDGLKICEKESSTRWKSGQATEDAHRNYLEFIERLKALAAEGKEEWENTTILPLPTRHGFSYGVLEGLKLVTTPYIMVVQHDRSFQQAIHTPSLLRDMKYHHYIWVEYVRALLSAHGIADLQWDPALPIGSPSVIRPGMPMDYEEPYAEPVRSNVNDHENEEMVRQHSLYVNPHWSVRPEKFTLNHLVAGFQPPFPIPYPQASTQQTIDPKYDAITTQITEQFRAILQPATLRAVGAPSSANLCQEYVHNTKTDLMFQQQSAPMREDTAALNLLQEQTAAIPTPQRPTTTPGVVGPSEASLFSTHHRRNAYPHPLPVHYVNFITNQTQQYLGRFSYTGRRVQCGALPAYYSSKTTNDVVHSDAMGEIVDDMNVGKAVLNIYDQAREQVKQKLRAAKREKKVEMLKHGIIPSDESNSSDDDDDDTSSSDGDNSNEEEEEEEQQQQNKNASFQTNQDILQLSQQHLATHCGVDFEKDNLNYHYGSRLVPMVYWYDSTHISMTQWYRELYTTEDRGSYNFIRPGDFAEDRLIQFTNALVGAGTNAEKMMEELKKKKQEEYETQLQNYNNNNNNNNNNNDHQPPTPPQLSAKELYEEIDNPLYWSTQQIVEHCPIILGRKQESLVLQAANKQFIPLPIDPQDEYTWSAEQRMMPFNYGAPPLARCKDLQQCALRIARCAKVNSFADAHNVSLQQFGMWLFEQSPFQYNDNGTEDMQDIVTHHKTCRRLRKTFPKDDKNGVQSMNLEDYTQDHHAQQLICGHQLKQLVLTTHHHREENTPQDGHVDARPKGYYVWTVVGEDYNRGMTVKHLDGNAYLAYEQKLQKQVESLLQSKKK